MVLKNKGGNYLISYDMYMSYHSNHTMGKSASVETFKGVLAQVKICTIGGDLLSIDNEKAIREQACNVRVKMTLPVIRIDKTRMLVIYCLYAASIETGIQIDIVGIMLQLGIPLRAKPTCITLFAGKGHKLECVTTGTAIMDSIKAVAPEFFPDDPDLHISMLEATLEDLSEVCEEISTSDSRIIAASIIIVYHNRLVQSDEQDESDENQTREEDCGENAIDQIKLCKLLNVKHQGVKKKSRVIQEIYERML